MSDDRPEPTEEQPDDRTRPISPAGGDPDGTAPLGRTPDETAPLGRTPDETAPLGRTPDETAPLDRTPGSAERPDGTAPLPPAQRSGPAAWSGRAEVPSVRPGAEREPSGGEWYADEQPGRPWWLPILWGVLLLLLLGLLGVGIWLARQALDEGGSPPASPQPTRQTPTATASPSPTTRSPSPPPTTSAAPAEVPVPPLVGLPEAAARALLDGLDLDYAVEYRPSDQPAGTVIATDPGAGELVAAGDEIRLVVAAASPSPSVTTGEPTTEPTATASPTG
ncbi:PASTA domain-containing protein [Micromonospora sp. WMMD1082]|uniref:PASTA domain-containing protein n=1 Tax=Micromonospora sp. WMMD1082 TaxID=3016104 RepID=UPI002416F61E|nr:PASTA domain-containing protein [Micromonospora sp. WMMD1082]MDG4794778.1 PASTA domain-containing protein [Micromonospora sp. WMMD1082]